MRGATRLEGSMQVDGKTYRTIWRSEHGERISIIDQTRLPHEFVEVELATLADAAVAIKDMKVGGSPRIGVAAAYGLALALRADASDSALASACATLAATRPTAVNLVWALKTMRETLAPLPPQKRAAAAFVRAAELAEEDVALCSAIGDHGLALIRELAARKNGGQVNILTHCNAGWLATVDWGTATAPIYKAQQAGLAVHVFVYETRPRNQGASLT